MASPPTVGGGTAADSRDPFDVDEGPAGGEEDEADLGAILRTAYTSGGGGGRSIIPSSSRPLSRSDTSSVDEGEPGKCLMHSGFGLNLGYFCYIRWRACMYGVKPK